MIMVELTREELRQKGWEALEKELGHANTVRFLQLLHPCTGDYTTERHQWLDDVDIMSIAQSIMEKRLENRE